MSYVTVKDVLDSAQKYGKNKVLAWSPDDFRDNKKNKKGIKSAFDCTWVNIKFKTIRGDEVPLRLKFNRVLTASSAKISDSADQNNLKNMIIAFRKFQRDELNGSDYAAKDMGSVDAQKEENKRADEAIESYLKSTNEFNDVLEIIDMSYQNVTNELKAAKTLEFTIRKDTKIKKNEDIIVYSIRQTTRIDKESKNQEEIKLDYPLTRIKLMLGKDGDVGIETWNRDINKFVFHPNVFDSRKMTAKNKYEPVLAKVKVNGKLENLNVKNASSFITYKSLVGGIVEFPTMIISKFGISFENKFRELYVRRHKTATSESMFSPSDIQEMLHGNEEEEEEDSDVELSTEAMANVQINENPPKEDEEAEEYSDSDLDA